MEGLPENLHRQFNLLYILSNEFSRHRWFSVYNFTDNKQSFQYKNLKKPIQWNFKVNILLTLIT